MKRLLPLIILVLQALTAAAQGSLEVIPLRHRSAEQVIPVLRPLVEPGGALSGQGYQLFVRTSAQNLADLKRTLAAIDTPQRRLMISVRFDTSADASNGGIGARGVRSSRSASDERIDQRVQVLEGGRAFISAGQPRALPQRQIISGPGGTIVQDSTVIQNLETGFEVVPRVSGSTVFLDLGPQREVPGAHGSASVAQLSSSISAQLGEWVELGGAVESGTRSASGILSAREARASESRRIWVKVEELRP